MQGELAFDTRFTPKPKEQDANACPANHVRFMGRCPVKKCKTCKAADVPLIEQERYNRGTWGQKPYHYQVKVPELCRLPEAKCAEHGYTLSWRQIDGKLSEVHKCDPRCTGATGIKCECACAGANHGADWL